MPAEVWAVLNYRTKAPANAAEVQPRLEWQLLHTTGVKRWSTSAVALGARPEHVVDTMLIGLESIQHHRGTAVLDGWRRVIESEFAACDPVLAVIYGRYYGQMEKLAKLRRRAQCMPPRICRCPRGRSSGGARPRGRRRS